MVLESLTKEGINIKDLVLNEPLRQANLQIGPGIELTEADWETMKKIPNYQIGFLGYMGKTLMYMKLLYPEKMGDLMLDEKVWPRLLERFNMLIVQYEQTPHMYEHYAYPVEILAEMKILFPEKRKEVKKYYENLKKKAKVAGFDTISPTLYGLPGFTANLAIVAPPELHSYPRLEAIRGGWLKNLEETQAEVLEAAKPNILPFANNAAEFRLTFPEYPLNIDQKIWGIMKGFLNQMGQNNPEQFGGEEEYFPWIAYCIKILAAREIKITDEGVRLIMPYSGQFTEAVPPMPQVRKF